MSSIGAGAKYPAGWSEPCYNPFRVQIIRLREMADSEPYIPAKVWKRERESGGRFANINRPVAGPTHEKDLQVGKHPLQLYSQGTPNGVKVTILLEELLAIGNTEGAEYDAGG